MVKYHLMEHVKFKTSTFTLNVPLPVSVRTFTCIGAYLYLYQCIPLRLPVSVFAYLYLYQCIPLHLPVSVFAYLYLYQCIPLRLPVLVRTVTFTCVSHHCNNYLVVIRCSLRIPISRVQSRKSCCAIERS